jgi:hypothetical protein
MMNRYFFRFDEIRWLAIPGVLALYFTIIVTSNGVPALRHDWNWPDYYHPFVNAISGWSEQGIGGANLFVNNYLLVVPLAPIGALLGPFPTLFIFVFGIGLVTLLAARSLASTVGASELGANAAGAFALFNPWVYTQIVAGHLPMIVAYAATIALLSEAIRANPRPPVCALAVAFTVAQLQFFVPALAIGVVVALRHKTWLPVLTWVVVGSASLLGLMFRAKQFATTPLTLAWEQTQSVAPLHALLLSGYFAKYTLGFDKLASVAVAIVAVLAVAGLMLSKPSRGLVVAGLVTVLALVLAMGLRGPASGVLAGALAHVPGAALYRELYDVIGFVAIGYLLLSAAAASRNVVCLSAFCFAAVLLIIDWTAFSPAHQWVNRATLPTIPYVAQSKTRFALFPPFQPLRYMGRFAGLDPDAVIRPDRTTPVNEEVPTWPEDSALARYLSAKDWRPLANLSVSEIANRPWYSSASRELLEQLAFAPPPPPSDWERVASSASIPAVPEISTIGMPDAVAIPSDPGAGAVFFGDVAGLQGSGVPQAWANYERPSVVASQNQFVHAADGWVDARLGFAADPQLGQPFGGALTTNPSALLMLSGGADALVFVKGELISDDGRVLSHDSRGYHWIPIPADVSHVRCRGLCVVVLEGRVPPGTKNVSVTAPYVRLDDDRFTPWLLRIEMPAGPAAALRYNARYDEHWLAWDGAKALIHVRVDGSVNGWLLGSRNGPSVIWLVEWVAFAQTVAQALGLMWLIALFWYLRRSRTARA